MFVIDACGSVVAANESARELWIAGKQSLVGLPIATLFAREGSSDDAEVLAAHWKELKTSAGERWTRRLAQPLEGPACEVRLRIERAFGGGGSYIGTIQPLLRGH